MSNAFMNIIKDTVPLTWKSISKYFKFKNKLRKFKKTIHNGSPSFGLLWSFADFIKYAELIFFFNNSKKNILYSSDGYEPGHNGFRITDKDFVLTVKLFSNTQSVSIDIEYQYSSRKNGNYTFSNNEWQSEPDEYDILLIDRVIAIINMNMIELLDYCIDKRKKDFIDYSNFPELGVKKFEELQKK